MIDEIEARHFCFRPLGIVLSQVEQVLQREPAVEGSALNVHFEIHLLARALVADEVVDKPVVALEAHVEDDWIALAEILGLQTDDGRGIGHVADLLYLVRKVGIVLRIGPVVAV